MKGVGGQNKVIYKKNLFPLFICPYLFFLGTKRPAEEAMGEPTSKTARSDLLKPTQTFERGAVPDASDVNLTGDKFKELMTKLEEAQAREERLAEIEAENERLRKESGIFEYAKKDIVEKEKKTLDDVGSYIQSLDERVLDTPEGKPYKNAFQFMRNQILPAKDHPEFLVSPAFQEKDKNFLLTMQAASLDAEFRVEEAKKESETLKSELESARKIIEELKQETLQKGAKIDFLQRGVRSSSYQSGVHTPPPSVMANASRDSMFSDYSAPTRPSPTPSPSPSPSPSSSRRGMFAAPEPKEPERKPEPRVHREEPSPVPQRDAMGSYRFKSSVDAFTKGFGMDPRFADALKLRQTGQLKMIAANASLDIDEKDAWNERDQLEDLKSSSKDDALPIDLSRWEGALGERIRFPVIY